MRLMLLAVGTAAVLTAPARADDPSPADVVRKAVDAHGGADALKKLYAAELKVSGEATVPGATSGYTGAVVYQLPDRYKISMELKIGQQAVSLAQVVNGKKVKTTVDGRPQKATEAQEAEARQAAAMQDMVTLVPLLGDRYKLAAGKPAEVSGSPAAAVVVSADGLRDVTLYFDAGTGRLVRAVRKALSPAGGDVTEETTLSEFKPAGGAVVPMKATVTHDGKPFLTLTTESLKPLDQVDPAAFAVDD